jgi:hypothetical protein
MNAASSRTNLLVIIAAFALGLAGAAPAAAEPSPDTENGRYALQPSGDSMIRLDTRTGAVSQCNTSEAGWACHELPDERKAMDEEIGRLRAENDRLKAQLAAREPAATGKIEEALPKSDKQVSPKATEGGRKIEIPLPSDQDLDRVMSFLERAWRRLIELANRVQKDVSGRI